MTAAAAAGPLVSVVTVCLNSAAQLPGAIASLAAQRWPEREWIVVDGGSTDGTLELVHGAPEPPARWLSEPDRGIYDAMNKGVALAQGEIVYFLNSDDRLHDPDVLADVARAFAADPGLALLFGPVRVVKPAAADVFATQRHVNRHTLPFVDACHQGLFARRRLFDEVGQFDLRWRTSADYDWMLRAVRAGHRMAHLDRPLAVFAAGGMHVRDPAALAAERRALRLQYLSPTALALGSLATRALTRVSRTLRGGLALGERRAA